MFLSNWETVTANYVRDNQGRLAAVLEIRRSVQGIGREIDSTSIPASIPNKLITAKGIPTHNREREAKPVPQMLLATVKSVP